MLVLSLSLFLIQSNTENDQQVTNYNFFIIVCHFLFAFTYLSVIVTNFCNLNDVINVGLI